ncbi:MAG: ZIP family metal transporter [Planctomycetota bacterium]
MLDFFASLNSIWQVLIATTFTWGMTALGASLVLFTKSINRKFLDGMLGFAAGVMIAATCWSLLQPAIEMSKGQSLPAWFPAAVGFLIGVAVISSIDKILPHLHIEAPEYKAEGIKTPWRRSVLLVLAITLHNFPEGLAIGVIFGAIHTGTATVTLSLAIALTIGLGLQNLPEGIAISFPLYREGISRWRSFWYGQLSAIVEPIGGVIGVMAVMMAHSILPYASGFAAGAMMFVVVEELIPESQQGDHPDIATLGTMIGFVGMMILDVAFS